MQAQLSLCKPPSFALLIFECSPSSVETQEQNWTSRFDPNYTAKSIYAEQIYKRNKQFHWVYMCHSLN